MYLSIYIPLQHYMKTFERHKSIFTRKTNKQKEKYWWPVRMQEFKRE